MLTLEFLPARHGDSFLVRWGTPQRVLLVDGGPDGVYENTLRPHLMSLPHAPGSQPLVDAVCVSHVDDDHIVGIIRLLRELVTARNDGEPLPIRIDRFWFNSVDALVDQAQSGLAASVNTIISGGVLDAAAAASFAQGSEVRDRAAALGLTGNTPFAAPLITGMTTDLYGLKVTVVGPNRGAMAELAAKWREAINKREVAVIANAFRDRSVPNLSSIAIHVDCGGRTALLTGDARGDHLIDGLEETGLLVSGAEMTVDVLKLPHHGSQNNLAPVVFERIRADHYVICADGIKHEHPSPATLEWLVSSRTPADRYTIHLTQRIPAAQQKLVELAAGRAFSVVVGSPHVEIKLPCVMGFNELR